jgi:Fe-S-cluster containining protein
MNPTYEKLLKDQNPKDLKKTAQRMRKMKKGVLDQKIHILHDEAFEQIDCLQCANCCKTTGPLLTQKDIERIAKHFRIKPGTFVEKYLRIDEDRDYVFNSMPCPFLGDDNYCSIYDVRPKACHEYPHTDRKNQQGILNLSQMNALICPAVAWIFKEIDD